MLKSTVPSAAKVGLALLLPLLHASADDKVEKSPVAMTTSKSSVLVLKKRLLPPSAHKLDQHPTRALAVVLAPKQVTDVDSLIPLLVEGSERQMPDFKHGALLTLLALGPILDSPDRAGVRSLVRHGDRLDMEIAHTNVHYQGVQLRKNSLTQPLAQVPIEGLPPGRYSLTVTWRPVKATLEGGQYRDPKPEDKALAEPKPLVQTIQFRILEK